MWNSTPWYTLTCTNFRVIPASDWTSVLKAQLLQNHYTTTTPKMSSWALNSTRYAHTPGSSHLPRHTRQSKGVIQRELALLPHIIGGGSCFDWARSEAGRKLDPLHWSRLSLSSLFSLSVSFSFCLDNHSSGTLQTNDLDSYWQHCHITPIISLNSPIRGQKPWKCLLHEGLKATDLSVTYSR